MTFCDTLAWSGPDFIYMYSMFHFLKVISTESMMIVNPDSIDVDVRVMQVWFERFERSFRNKSRGDLEIKNYTSDLIIFRREPVPS